MAIKPRKYQTSKGPRWMARWTKRDGSQGSHGGFKTEREAKAYSAKQESGILTDPILGRTKLADWAETWLDAQGHQKTKTLDGYRGLWRSRVGPVWGQRALDSIEPLEVQAWVNRLKAEDLSHSRIRQPHQNLDWMLEAAGENGRIAKNPVGRLKLTKTDQEEALYYHRALDLGQVTRLLQVAREDRYVDGVLVMFMVASGLRFGEVRGLTQASLQLAGSLLPFPSVQVLQSVTDTSKGPLWGPPKNHQRRTVYLPRSVSELLLELPVGRDGLVFTSPKGMMLDPNNFRNGPFARWKKEADLPEGLRPHDLRHTCGTLMANSGVPLIQVKEHLGHSSVAVTERYLHPQPFGDRPMVSSLREWLEADVLRGCWTETGLKESRKSGSGGEVSP